MELLMMELKIIAVFVIFHVKTVQIMLLIALHVITMGWEQLLNLIVDVFRDITKILVILIVICVKFNAILARINQINVGLVIIV